MTSEYQFVIQFDSLKDQVKWNLYAVGIATRQCFLVSSVVNIF